LAIVANLVEPATEDVLWHMTLSYHAELKGTAAAAARGKAEAAVAAAAGKRRRSRNLKDPAEAAAQAAAAVQAPVSLHLLRKRELMSGMLTQVTDHLTAAAAACCGCC
jgi:predicted deacetylase